MEQVFLLTDIEGSTRLWDRVPRAMAVALARHDEIAGATVERNGGVLIKSRGEGDSTFSVFTDPVAATRCAVEMQRELTAETWPPEASLRARIALHLGWVEERDGDLFGEPVNRCARLRSAGHGGQILLTEAVASAVGSRLPDGVTLTDLGVHRLRDLSRPERIYELTHAGLPSGFPPLATIDARRHNVPTPVTSFVGREAEILRVKSLFDSARVVTVTGPGGTGKSRLAMRVALDLLGHYPDGVWVVELTQAADGAAIPQVFAQALGLREEPGSTLVESIRNHLRDRNSLVVLDNCEHLVASCAELAASLLAASPGLRLLVTSREILGVPGETPVALTPLDVPEVDSDDADIVASPSVQLFLARSGAGPRADGRALSDVAEICRRLDGIPLAIEIVAAKARTVPVEILRERLSDRFALVAGGTRTGLARHRTLRATIDWSFEFLSAQERHLLARLSVFVGGCSLGAAEQVCGGQELPRSGVVDTLGTLVDKSMVSVVGDAPGRYRMLETIREYAAEKLVEWGELPYVRAAHLAWASGLAASAVGRYGTPDEAAMLRELAAEAPNLRSALEWAEDTGALRTALEMAVALSRSWELHGYWTEGALILTRLLEAVPERDATWCAGCLALCRLQQDIEDADEADRLAHRCLASSRELGDRKLEAAALYELGSIALNTGRSDPEEQMNEALRIRREIGDERGVAESLTNLSYLHKARGDLDRAEAVLSEALDLFRSAGNLQGISWALTSLANTRQRRGDLEGSRVRDEEALAIRRTLGDRNGIGDSLVNLGVMWMHEGDVMRALECLEDAAEAYYTVGSRLTGLKRDLGLARFLVGDVDGAVPLLLDHIGAVHEEFAAWAATPLAALGCIAVGHGLARLGVRCIAAADRIAAEHSGSSAGGTVLREGVLASELSAALAEAERALALGFDEAWRAGTDEQVALLLIELRSQDAFQGDSIARHPARDR